MYERSNGNKRGSGNGWNANSELPPACRDLVESLCERIQRRSMASEYLCAEYRSKYNGPGTCTPAERRFAAIRKWRYRESVNKAVNDRLRGMDRGFNVLPRVTFYRFLEHAQRLVSSVLGPLDDDIVLGSFSGGASTSRLRSSSSSAEKYHGQVDITQDAVDFTQLIQRLSPLYRRYGFPDNLRVVQGAVLFTVPKNSDIDRCACKEPDINMFLQKGVGSHIRRRLRRFGVELNDQSINRSYAKLGSIDGSLATVDLSSASDSVTVQCVRSLLPQDWFEYMNYIRSRFVEVDGIFSETGMFSSMGNGFTFELESLIFWALVRTVCYFRGYRGIVSVYGDDIILPSEAYDDVIGLFSIFGFEINQSKSFATGSFRESCGGHYDNGVDVTPFYLRRPPSRLTDVIRVANQLRRWAMADWGRAYEHPELFPLWEELASYVPKDLWGGSYLEGDTQLCSPNPPLNRLSRISRDKDVTESGRYLHWHTLNRDRSWEAEKAFPIALTTRRCRKRRANPGALMSRWHFPEEV